MSRIWRIALMWLLVVAVPAQGVFAATMFHCGPAHGEAEHAAAHAMHSHQHGVGLAMGSHHHRHGLGGPAHSHGDDDLTNTATGDHQAATASSALEFTNTSCSACASCCTAAALPSAIATFEASPVHEGVVAWLPLPVPAFFTDGPDRPPRTVLA